MRNVYFVTEGVTDQIVLEALVSEWLGGEDYVPSHIQPPSSDYADHLETSLSQGWRGVVAWCFSQAVDIRASREHVLASADLLVIHIDADVAFDPQFSGAAYAGALPPAEPACDHVRSHLIHLLGGVLPNNVALCVPAQDLECWVVCCLFPEVADNNAPIDCNESPAGFLVERRYSLVRRKDGRLRKNTFSYEAHAPAIVAGWDGGVLPRCSSAVVYMDRVRQVLAL
jgi:hypothetical protein